MTCQEVADFLLDYLASELPPDVRLSFDAHLHVCPNCREYLAIYRTTLALERVAFHGAAAPEDCGIPEELVTAILAARAPRG